MTFEDKIKTTYKEVTENSDASSKNLKVSRKSSTRSTFDSRPLRLGEDKQERQHPLTGQRAANFRLLANQ